MLVPAEEPLANALAKPGGARPTVILTLRTDDGIEGIGFTFFGAAVSKGLRTTLDDLCGLIVGMDPLARGAVLAKLYTAAGGAGPAGMFTLAISAIDIALWDIAGKAQNMPLWRLLGGSGERVPTYASGALMRELDLAAAEASAVRLKEAGHTAVKMQLALPGRATPTEEIERARRIRAAVGPDIALMCDINQRWRLDQAISIGSRLEEVGFAWLEDVIAADDFTGLAAVAQALSTPLAGGEYLYGLAPFRQMLQAGAIDIVMVDPFRIGGITQWLKVAGMAEAYNRPVVSHLAPELQVHLIGAVPNGMIVEYMPWSVRLFEEVPWPDNGYLALPTGPGLGLCFDRRALDRFRV